MTIRNRVLVVVAALPLLGLLGTAEAGWQRLVMATTTQSAIGTGLTVGQGRNDNVTRVYGRLGGSLGEFSYADGGWALNLLNAGDIAAIKQGRNDGVWHLYAAWPASELTWTGSTWTVGPVGLSSVTIHAVGPGRNDAMNRVYMSSYPINTIWEANWTGSSWTVASVGFLDGYYITDLAIGPGRNDGVMRLYAVVFLSSAVAAPGTVYEFSWTGSTWTRLTVGAIASPGDAGVVRVGPGRNDGVQRIYAMSFKSFQGSEVTEFTWNGSQFTPQTIAVARAHDMALGDARGDGRTRMYLGGEGAVDEYTWVDGAWRQSGPIGGGEEYGMAVAIGTGRNDGVGVMKVFPVSRPPEAHRLAFL